MTSGTPSQRAFVIRSRNRLFECFLTGFQDRQHLSGFAASRAIDAVEFLARMPAVDQPVEEITLSHLSAASLPEPYGQRRDKWSASLESLHTPGRRYFSSGGYPS